MRNHEDVIGIILCKSCGGSPEQGVITGYQYAKGDWELGDAPDGKKQFICQRCINHPGIDPEVIFEDRGSKLWIDRIALTP